VSLPAAFATFTSSAVFPTPTVTGTTKRPSVTGPLKVCVPAFTCTSATPPAFSTEPVTSTDVSSSQSPSCGDSMVSFGAGWVEVLDRPIDAQICLPAVTVAVEVLEV